MIWVDVTSKKKRRSSPRAVRFAELKVGDQLELVPKADWHRKIPLFNIVTDMWFDPVAGQENEVAGIMVALRRIGDHGDLIGHKSSHTLRGLASEGYHYAKKDIIAERKTRLSAMNDGGVVGIAYGNIVRRRPKLPGGQL